MKKFYKIVIGIIVVVFILLITIPLLFQDKIIGLVKQTINNNVNAQVDFSDGNLSLLRNFPHASVHLSNISVINNAPFKGDTLLYAKDITLKLKLTELFKNSSEQLHIKSFVINGAKVNIITNEQGNTNYDIAKQSEENKTEQTHSENSSSNFGLSINNYSIKNSLINYADRKGKINLLLTEFNHSGSGDFSQSKTKLDTKTSTVISFGMNGVSYAKNQKISLDAVLDLDLVNKKFSFLKNKAKLNNLPLVFSGFVKVNDNNQEVAVDFKTPSSDFKNFLGLIPEVYAKNISGVKTSGNFSINGNINGIVDEKNIPKLAVNINAENASFQYPDLPKSVRNININAQIKNTSGKVENTFIAINNLGFTIDEDIFSGKGTIHNITSNPSVNATINGTLNLANLNKAYPIDLKNELSGILKANLHTQFDMQAIKKNIVDRIKNDGNIAVHDFTFSSKDVVNPIEITATKVNFTPKVISLTKFDAKTGNSDLHATGKINNLLGFLLSNKKLQGTFNVKSTTFYVSDFMQKSTAVSDNNEPKKDKKSSKDPVSEKGLKIPAFLDCKVLADVATVYYDNLKLKNVKGTLWLKDEKATLENMTAGIFNGKISLNGEVNTQKKEPTFAMKLGINSFDISQSFSSMKLLQSLSPIAGAMDGKLNSDINLSGSLNNDFSPNLATLSGKALAELLTTKINPEKTKVLSLLSNKLSFIDLTKLDLSDLKAHLSFNNGKVNVKPFKLKYKDIGINISGSHSFDQSMDYQVTFDVPVKYLGNSVAVLLTKLSAKEQNMTIPVTANITGNMTSPHVQTDLSSSVTKLGQKLIQQQKNNLVNNTLGKLLGNAKKDSTKTNGKNTITKKVTDVLGGLFGKKNKRKNSLVILELNQIGLFFVKI